MKQKPNKLRSLLSPPEKALRSSKWAKTMTKWLISMSTSRKSRWRFVEFGGPTGAESRGIVDFLAIRKDHGFESQSVLRGDLFEIVLFQTKGGSARMPTKKDRDRLRAVKRHHRARDVLLAVRNRGVKPSLYKLMRDRWEPVDAKTFLK